MSGPWHGKRGIGLAVRHFETDHRAVVLLLERLHLAAGLDDDDRERAAIELGAASQNRVDEAAALRKRNSSHRPSRAGGGRGWVLTLRQANRGPRLVDFR